MPLKGIVNIIIIHIQRCEQNALHNLFLTSLSTVSLESQYNEIHAVPSRDPGFLMLPSGYSEPTANFPGREVEENTAVSPAPPSPIKGVSERSSEVLWERPQRLHGLYGKLLSISEHYNS